MVKSCPGWRVNIDRLVFLLLGSLILLVLLLPSLLLLVLVLLLPSLLLPSLPPAGCAEALPARSGDAEGQAAGCADEQLSG